MGLRINSNIPSLASQRNLSRQSNRLGTSFSRLATGRRVNSAADDAAGLAISSRFDAQLRSLDQASRNANNGISLVQTAEGALGQTSEILGRLRELSVQAANGTLSQPDKDALQAEFSTLVDEVDRIGNSTRFNDQNLLDGESNVSLQVGTGNEDGTDSIDVTIDSARSGDLGLSSLSIADDPSTAISALDSAITRVASQRGSLGAIQTRLGSTIENNSVRSEQLHASNSRIRDADYAKEQADLTRNALLNQFAAGVSAQANIQPQIALSLLQ